MFCYSFSVGKRTYPNAIHSEVHPVYGDKCFTRRAVHVWCKKFAHDQESVVDEKRPGRCVVLTTNAVITALESFIQCD